MSLTNASDIASKSLGTISSQLSVISRNISSAGTPGVSAKKALVGSDESGAAAFLGVARNTNKELYRNLLGATAAQGANTQISTGLDQIDRALGLSDPENSRSPAATISRLTSALQTYSASPDNQTAAQLALSAARDVVSSLHEATDVTQNLRRQMDADMSSSVDTINSLLARFETLNRDIVSRSASGADVTDALDQRDALLTQLSGEIGVRTLTRPNNDMVIYTDSGVTLLETSARTISFKQTQNLAPGVAGNAVFVDGVQVTGAGAPLAIHAGALQGRAQLRDNVAPQYQKQLDEIARGLVVAFSEQDQSGGGGPALPGLFTFSGASSAPAATVIDGLANQVTINANVDPDQGGVIDRLRDGGISGGAQYVSNTGGGAGYATRLLELVNATSSSQSFDVAGGLEAETTTSVYAANSNGWIGAHRQLAARGTTYYDALVSQTTQALSNATGVNLDDQMAQMAALENSYQASAKLLQSINGLFDALFAAIRN